MSNVTCKPDIIPNGCVCVWGGQANKQQQASSKTTVSTVDIRNKEYQSNLVDPPPHTVISNRYTHTKAFVPVSAS